MLSVLWHANYPDVLFLHITIEIACYHYWHMQIISVIQTFICWIINHKYCVNIWNLKKKNLNLVFIFMKRTVGSLTLTVQSLEQEEKRCPRWEKAKCRTWSWCSFRVWTSTQGMQSYSRLNSLYHDTAAAHTHRKCTVTFKRFRECCHSVAFIHEEGKKSGKI